MSILKTLKESFEKIFIFNQLVPQDAEMKMRGIKQKSILVALSALGALLILVATHWYGAGLSPDSVGYIGTARNIASGAGVTSYDGSPLIVQPPLYPLILAIVQVVTGTDPLNAAPYLNAILFGALIYLSGWLIFRLLKPAMLLPFVATAMLLVTVAPVEVALMAWSELLFMCFVMLFLNNLRLYQDDGELRTVVLLAVSVMLATMTRYIGIILVPVGVVCIPLLHHHDRKTRMRNTGLFAGLSVLPMILWGSRNYLTAGSAFGQRTSSIFSISHNARLTFDTVFKWYLPDSLLTNTTILVLSGLVLSFFAGALLWGKRSRFMSIVREVGFIVLLIAAYAVFMIIYSSITSLDEIGDRLLAPIAVPVLLLLAYSAGKAANSLGRRFSAMPVKLMTTAVLAAIMVYPAVLTYDQVRNQIDFGGWGYNGKFWKDSATIQYLTQHPHLDSNCTVYTNGPDLAYILADVHGKMAPLKSNVNSHDALNSLSQMKGTWPPENNACLLWFNSISGDYLFTVRDLGTAADLQVIHSFDDGALFRLTRRSQKRLAGRGA